MKKLMLLFLCAVLILPISATPAKIVDQAQLLSGNEITQLESKMDIIIDVYQMDIALVTVTSLEGKTAQMYADDYYDQNGYGVDPEKSGILLLLDMNSRSWAISTYGEAIYAISDPQWDGIMDNCLGEFSADRYYEGFSAFIQNVTWNLSQNIEEEHTEPGIGTTILISLAIGLIVSGIAILIMRAQMNTFKRQSGAHSYMTEGSFHLYQHMDIFLYSRTTKTRKSDSNSTHRSSSGRSHGGRSGRF